MLTVVEGRVLGCLLEKERTVPDQYPLTIGALVSACNQTTSRDPVLHLAEPEVLAALATLKVSGFVRMVHPSHGRSATRYRHVADERLGLDAAAAALLAVLLLRGPQTAAELRARSERQHAFGSIDEVEQVLRGLAERGLARLLERSPGRKEPRWQQLAADEDGRAGAADAPAATAPQPAEATAAAGHPDSAGVVAAPVIAPPAQTSADELTARIEELEARVARLEAALSDLL